VQETPSLQLLLDEITPKAQEMIPSSVKEAVMQEILSILDREVEKA